MSQKSEFGRPVNCEMLVQPEWVTGWSPYRESNEYAHLRAEQIASEQAKKENEKLTCPFCLYSVNKNLAFLSRRGTAKKMGISLTSHAGCVVDLVQCEQCKLIMGSTIEEIRDA
jgi:hypothetical protein